MLCLTIQERKVILFIASLILIGSLIKYFTKTSTANSYPKDKQISTILDFNDSKTVIDINNASQEEFEKLSGIGKAISGRIIDYRNSFGPFNNLEDLTKVKGIGHKKLEAIKDYLTVH